MFSSAAVGMLALLRAIRSIGHTFKSLILHCLLLWPHRDVFSRLKRCWSLYYRSPKDVPKKKGGQARPPFPGVIGEHEGYITIYASRDFSRPGEHSEPPSTLGGPEPGNPEVFHRNPFSRPSASVPHSPASSHAFVFPGSPQRSVGQHPVGSTPSIAGSHSADIIQPLTRRSNTPPTLAGSPVTPTQFAEAPPPYLSHFPTSSPLSHPLPNPSTMENFGSVQIAGVVPTPQDTPERSRQSSLDITVFPQDTSERSRQSSSLDITVFPPSRPETLDIQSTLNISQSPLSL